MGHHLRFATVIPCTQQQLWEFHQSAEALKILTPPSRQVRLLNDDLEVRNGAVHKIAVKQFGLWLEWHALISEVTPPEYFVDSIQKGPFKKWRHKHTFRKVSESETELIDEIEYQLPMGPFGAIANALFVEKDLQSMFAYRHQQTIQAFRASNPV
jgi:ligand-binding SRPBCC domain-containing protein